MQYIGTQTMKQRLENHEMEKFKSLNEELLDDEDHPELIDLCNKILRDLATTTEHFKKIAKRKGMKYEIKSKGTLAKKRPTQDSMSSLNAANSQRMGSLSGESENQPTLTMGGESRNLAKNESGRTGGTPEDYPSREGSTSGG